MICDRGGLWDPINLGIKLRIVTHGIRSSIQPMQHKSISRQVTQTAKSAMVRHVSVWRHNKLFIAKLGIIWNFVTHNFWSGLGFFWRGYPIHQSHFLGNFCMTLLVLGLIGLGTRSAICIIFVLRCLNLV